MKVHSPKIVVLIAVDPMKDHRAVEALRIALGLGSHNEGVDVSIVLSGRSPFLLAEDTSDIMDGEILEKHLPVFIEWGSSFAIAADAGVPLHYVQGCKTTPVSLSDIAANLELADRVLIFS
ncbi:MAG: hypothetical protein FD174_4344 [Geobacteraceae bacterium]|nr:MAG: hypothetical protein FD174_4344 [Geobacteraceae bacterium]